MDSQGFNIGLKTKFKFDPAWKETKPEESSMYPGGHYEVGNKFRPERHPTRELFRPEFSSNTTPNYLHSGNFMIKSTSHRSIDARFF